MSDDKWRPLRIPVSHDEIMLRVQELHRQVDELRTAREIEVREIGKGGIRLGPGGFVRVIRPDRFWSRLWLAWTVLGLGSAALLIAAQELGVSLPAGIWWWWAVPGVAGGGALEILALRDRIPGNTLSEFVVRLGEGPLSLVIVGCLWAMWWLATGDAWPSAGIFFVGWCAWHWATWRPNR